MKETSSVRIIAGKWRSRRVSFPETLGLRPTQDRIRETLFNWLSPFILGSHCLDLFAGSGVLGFEALSRGAGFCCFVDQNPRVVRTIIDNSGILKADTQSFSVVRGGFPNKLPPLPGGPYDIVFLDPPFGQGLLNKALAWLHQSSLIKAQALIYFEMEKDLPLSLPENYGLHRQHSTATLKYGLIRTLP